MPVSIVCPKCSQQVELRQHGFVKKHGGEDPCTFVRTAHTGGEFGTKDEQLARAAKKAAAAEAVRAKNIEDRRIQETSAARAKELRLKQKRADELAHPLLLCAKCEGKAHSHPGSSLPQAHLRSDSNRWCSGGVAPTDEQRKKAAKGKKKRSVWTTSGGLPTLGRQR